MEPEFIILGLATWRVSSLLVNEEGPWNLLSKFRYLAGMRYDEFSSPYGKNVFGELLICVWCLSVWIGGAFALSFWWSSRITTLVALPFALSAVAVIVERWASSER